MTADPRSQALKTLSTFLIADSSTGDALHEVSVLACSAIGGADFVGIALLDNEGKQSTGVYTDPESPALDRSQYESGRGPCLDAWRQRRTIRIGAMQDAKRTYPEFSSACLEHGIQSTLSVGLIAGGNGVGALNFYARKPEAFSDEEKALAEDLGAVAAAVMANANAYWGATKLGEGLAEAMKTRAVIEQAKGFLMATSPKLDADGAFELLKQASQRENVKLREIAERIVARRPPPAVTSASN